MESLGEFLFDGEGVSHDMRVVGVDDRPGGVPHLDPQGAVRQDAVTNECIKCSIPFPDHVPGCQVERANALQQASMQVVKRCLTSLVDGDALHRLTEDDGKHYTKHEEDEEARDRESA